MNNDIYGMERGTQIYLVNKYCNKALLMDLDENEKANAAVVDKYKKLQAILHDIAENARQGIGPGIYQVCALNLMAKIENMNNGYSEEEA